MWVRIPPWTLNKTQQVMNHPDPKKHKQISFVKSAFRFAGYIMLPWNIMFASTLLILAEALGVYEETV